MNEAQRRAAPVDRRPLQYPVRIGLFFLPPTDGSTVMVPTADQQSDTLRAIRARLVVRPFVEEVIIVPAYFVGTGRDGDFRRIQELAQRFDFDLVGLVACSQVTREFRNLKPMGLITFLGDMVWPSDVDVAETSVSITFVEPRSSSLLTFATGMADWGDTTTLVDDWRSPGFVRRGSFDRAVDNLLSNMIGATNSLEPGAQRTH